MERPDFIPLFRQVVDHPKCTTLDAVVFGYIYWLTKLKNERCTASNDTIAALAKSTVTSVQNSLTTLERAGFIRRIFKGGNPKSDRLEIIPLLAFTKLSPTSDSSYHPQVVELSPTGDQSKSIELEKDTADAAPVIEVKEEATVKPPKDIALKGIRWAEHRRGTPFINKTKQIAAINKALRAGFSQKQLTERWEEMEEDKYWQERGFDWLNVVNSFDRK